MDLEIKDEHEAAVAILFSCVLHKNRNLTQAQVEQLSRMLVLSSRFRDVALNELTVKALSLQSVWGSKTVIEESAPLVADDFKETLFAMACEMMTTEGQIDEQESEIIALTALSLGITMDIMKMMLTTYLVRNRWNVKVVEDDQQ